MLITDIRWAVIPRGLRHCREWWNEVSLSGQGDAVVAGIVCAHLVSGARRCVVGIGALDAVGVREWLV